MRHTSLSIWSRDYGDGGNKNKIESKFARIAARGRGIGGVKKTDKRRMEELGEEVGIEEGSRRKSRSRLKWAEQVEQMEVVDEESGCT